MRSAFSDWTKSSVFAMRALSSGSVFSTSSCRGISTPARRATAPFAVSQAICTCRENGNMSGKSRKPVRTSGSTLRASQCACALSRIAERLPRVLANRGAEAWYIERVMVRILEERQRARLDALARRRAGRRGGIVEGSVRREARTAVVLGIVDLEHDRLVAPHARKVIPAMRGVVLEAIGLPDAMRIAALGDEQVARGDAVRVRHGKRVGFERARDRPPELHDGEAPREERLRLVAHQLAHALRPGPLGVVVVRGEHRLAHELRFALGLFARAQGVVER